MMNLFQCIAILLWLFSAQQEATVLKVKVSGIAEPRGQVVIALFDKAEGFLKEDMVHKYVRLDDTNCQAEFAGLAPGHYAVSVFHDRNMNGKLDTNIFGIPTEPYGFSNNASGTFGPPEFMKASFRYPETTVLNIELR